VVRGQREWAGDQKEERNRSTSEKKSVPLGNATGRTRWVGDQQNGIETEEKFKESFLKKRQKIPDQPGGQQKKQKQGYTGETGSVNTSPYPDSHRFKNKNHECRKKTVRQKPKIGRDKNARELPNCQIHHQRDGLQTPATVTKRRVGA